MNKITWHAIHIKCECEKSEIFIADEWNEDCNAYEEAKKHRGICTDCGQRKIVRIIRTK